MSNAILFIDSHVSEYSTLLAGLASDVEVHLLNANEEGVLQMAAILQGRTGLDSIQIVSHGSSGSLSLGSGVLNSSNLDSYSDALAQIGSSLSATGDILLYGCDVAQGDSGLSFINQLATITGADVAASDDLTGNAALGGDWVLEANTGMIESVAPFNASALQNYSGVLPNNAPIATYFFNFNAPPTTNPYGITDVGTNAGPTFADINGDSKLDLIIGNAVGDTLVYLNTGTTIAPSFAAPLTNPYGITTRVSGNAKPTFADINGDGKLDLFIISGTNTTNTNTFVYLNTGTTIAPSFAAPLTNPYGISMTGVGSVLVSAAVPEIADINGDGLLDFFMGNADGNLFVCLNTGTITAPTFAAALLNPYGFTKLGNNNGVTIADINGDGKLDIFTGNRYGTTHVYLNTGTITAPTFAVLPNNPYGITTVGNPSNAAPTIADINGDGLLDVFFGNALGNTLVFLGDTSIKENVAVNSVIGTLSSTDPDAGDTLTYSLVTGTGSTDNSAFTIASNQLQINSSPDFEAKASYSVLVRTTDLAGLTFDKALTITINDVNEVPTDLAISVSNIKENVAVNSVIGTLSSTDPDAGNTFTYSLVTGTGDTDNSAFTLAGNQLKINSSPDFETKASYSVLVRTTDQGGLFFDKPS